MSAPDTTGPDLLQFASGDAGRYCPFTAGSELSAWSRSGAKRAFDVAVVLAFVPILAPLFLVIAVVVRLTSRGPAIFRQTRIGRFGMPFTILKFRTMWDSECDQEGVVAPAASERITAIGGLLRRFKLDELPQVLNVLRGDMSLVGPRPKIPEHQVALFSCRPGLSSPATLLFAREELLLAKVPPDNLARYYRDQVLPLKHGIDAEYMSRANALSDMWILVRTMCARWADGSALMLPPVAEGESGSEPAGDAGETSAFDLMQSN